MNVSLGGWEEEGRREEGRRDDGRGREPGTEDSGFVQSLLTVNNVSRGSSNAMAVLRWAEG